MKKMIAPTLACADLMNVSKDIQILDEMGVCTYHIDIMDGNFVPNYCLSFDFIRQLRNITNTPIDVHLMTTEVDRDIDISLSLGVEGIAFHIEASGDTRERLLRIQKCGVKAGIVINPETPVSSIFPYIDNIDYVLMMGVKPGFSGQKFINDTFEKVKELNEYREHNERSFLIYVDGGITNEIGKVLADLGADLLVAGKPSIYRDKGKLREQTQEFYSAINS